MILLKRFSTVASLIFVMLFVHTDVRAAIVEYDLTIARQEVNFTGKPTQGMTINGGIKGDGVLTMTIVLTPSLNELS